MFFCIFYTIFIIIKLNQYYFLIYFLHPFSFKYFKIKQQMIKLANLDLLYTFLEYLEIYT